MSLRTVLAHSDEVDTADAIRVLLERCERELAGATPRGGIVFMTREYDHAAVLGALRSRWPGLALVGASTDGEVSSQLGYRGDSVCLTLFVGDDVDVCVGQGLEPSRNLELAVDQALACLADREPKLCIVFCPGTTGNASAVIDALHARLSRYGCPIVGGLSGDHEVTPTTKQFFGDQAHHDSLVVLFLCGADLRVSYGVASGWFPIGGKHVVTRSVGNTVYAIDGRPALEIYQSLWGQKITTSLGEYPLAVYCGPGQDDFVLRAAMSCDERAGSVTFAGDVPEGAVVSVTEVVPEGLLSGTEASIRNAIQRFTGDTPELALLISCAARKWVLGSRADAEIRQLLATFEGASLPKVRLAGFYSFGEICPVDVAGPPRLHNETCVTVLIGR